MNPTLAIPVLATSNPTPALPPPVVGVNNSRLSLASFALSCPKWNLALACQLRPRGGKKETYEVFLLDCVLDCTKRSELLAHHGPRQDLWPLSHPRVSPSLLFSSISYYPPTRLLSPRAESRAPELQMTTADDHGRDERTISSSILLIRSAMVPDMMGEGY